MTSGSPRAALALATEAAQFCLVCILSFSWLTWTYFHDSSRDGKERSNLIVQVLYKSLLALYLLMLQ